MDKKNTLLLTVIAIATLLVAVVGATFAYFSAQTGNNATADVNVTTSTVDSTTITKFPELTLQATQQNFGQGMGSLYAESEGSITFTANSDKDSEYCYKVDLTIESNNFEYSLSADKPELIFTISKQSASGALTEYSVTTLGRNTATAAYKEKVLGETTNLCKYNGNPTTQSNETCDSSKALNGYDITTIKTGTIEIPNGPTVSGTTDNDYIHKISASKGASTTDKWVARVTFANYDEDQQKNAQLSAEDTTHGKTLSAKVNFTPTPCAAS